MFAVDFGDERMIAVFQQPMAAGARDTIQWQYACTTPNLPALVIARKITHAPAPENLKHGGIVSNPLDDAKRWRSRTTPKR